MTLKEWLNRGRDAERILNSLERGELSVNNSRLERVIEKKKQQLYEIKEEIYEVIDSVSDGRYFVVLYERYIEMKTWEEIAKDNHYSRSHVIRLHGEALKRVKFNKSVLKLTYKQKVSKANKKKKKSVKNINIKTDEH